MKRETEKVKNAAKTAIVSCMGTQKSEKLLILTDLGNLHLAKLFAQAGKESGIDTVMACGLEQIGGEIPELCQAALEKSDVCLMVTTGSFTHTRGRWEATERGCRIASMPGITEEILTTALNADYDEIERIGNTLAEKLSVCSRIHVITAAGTDITLCVEGREGLADTGKLVHYGAFGNLPAGEAMIAPCETKGEGILVVDGVISDFKVMESPLKLTFKKGRIVKVEGEDSEAFELFVSRFADTARNIAEFGIGTNPECRIIGNGLVDEKVYGTIHIACGNNLFMGGRQDCDMHYDMIIKRPTVYLDDECILENGKHVY